MKTVTSWNRVIIMSDSDSHAKQHIVHQHELNANDVLSGRGGWVQQYSGNVQYRRLLRFYNQQYNDAERGEKMKIVETVFDTIQTMDPPGRFLKEQSDDSDCKEYWVEIDRKDAIYKTRKAIRSIGRMKAIKGSKGGSRSQPSSTCSSPEPMTVDSNNQIDSAPTSKRQSISLVAAFPQLNLSNQFEIPSSAGVSLHNKRSTIDKRRQYYKLRHEQTVLPPLSSLVRVKTNNTANNSNFLRTFSNERHQLMLESNILSSKKLDASESSQITHRHSSHHDHEEQTDNVLVRQTSFILPSSLSTLNICEELSMNNSVECEEDDCDSTGIVKL